MIKLIIRLVPWVPVLRPVRHVRTRPAITRQCITLICADQLTTSDNILIYYLGALPSSLGNPGVREHLEDLTSPGLLKNKFKFYTYKTKISQYMYQSTCNLLIYIYRMSLWSWHTWLSSDSWRTLGTRSSVLSFGSWFANWSLLEMNHVLLFLQIPDLHSKSLK